VSELSFIAILLTAIGLSADCFAVAVSISISERNLTIRQLWRFPVAFGVFQGGMIGLGWLAGRTIVNIISSYDHWLAFGLLAFIGGRMIWESFHEKEEKPGRKVTSWLTLLALAIATSIDALAAGLSYAFLNVGVLMACVTTGLTTFFITILGHAIGKRVGALVERWADIAGGIILIAIGVKILLQHIL
jgi:manganese efflux pump family protein